MNRREFLANIFYGGLAAQWPFNPWLGPRLGWLGQQAWLSGAWMAMRP